MTLQIEICPNEPRAMFADVGNHADDIADCTRPGDAEGACEYIRDSIGVEFRIIARNSAGGYESRIATDNEIEATARAIYFESDSDFSDPDIAALYLIWDAAHNEIY